MSAYEDERIERRSFHLANGWSFSFDRFADHAVLFIPVTGWGGYGGAAIPAQEAWVVEQLESLEGVTGTWMGCWRVEAAVIEDICRRLEDASRPSPKGQ